MIERTVTLGTDHTVAVRRDYATTVDDLWDACTNPERLPRWFLPVSGDLQVGGRYQLEGNAGGTIEACDPPRSFRATWEFGGKVSRIEVRVTAAGDGARLELIHSAQSDDDHWQQFGPGATGLGWDMTLHGLGTHIDTRADNDAAEFMAWVASDDGKAFLTEANAAWRFAHLAAGASETTADSAATATLAAYTGAT